MLGDMILILERLNLYLSLNRVFIMGFADLSIAEIAADYNLPVEEVLALCDQLGIAYKTSNSRLALEDAKEIISQVLSQRHRSDAEGSEGGTKLP